MTCQIENDIVRRALIALLTPEATREARRLEPIDDRRARKETPRRRGRAATPARIFIVEQPTSLTLTVCWSDPQSGHYGEQLWRKGVARRASFCVLTGERIRPGDAVFRPRAGESHLPANRDYMLLAAAVPAEASLVT
ncbi:DUF3331 domain-containing protein [Paraburkholderia sp. C35]|uniref:DUF3331 domain-containing protein n=1 Tax=Paraburkholderia sp. C35 TaxID=2126993 RepID=UPI000D68B867|nr:DUF3331 domain-containing protein [Paraburkholderia sp. C35]